MRYSVKYVSKFASSLEKASVMVGPWFIVEEGYQEEYDNV